MDLQGFTLSQSSRWYRSIVNIYWAIALLVLILELVAPSIDDRHIEHAWFHHNILLQVGILIGIIAFVEVISVVLQWKNDYILLLLGILISSILVVTNPHVGIIPVVYLLPLFISILTMNRLNITMFGILSMLSYGIIYLVHPELKHHVTVMELVGTMIMYALLTVGSLIIAKRMSELLTQLRKTTEDQQYLLAQNAFMEKLSKIDALTGLYNHKTFHQYLDNLIEQCELNSLTLQLAILDIDNFKRVNDTYGHWVGDQVLLRVASVMQKHITPNDFAARYGGEEFAVIFTEKQLKEAVTLLEKIRLEISLMSHEEMDGKAVTISIGLKNYVLSTGKEGMFRAADEALYQAKKAGKNRIIVSGDRGGNEGLDKHLV